MPSRNATLQLESNAEPEAVVRFEVGADDVLAQELERNRGTTESRVMLGLLLAATICIASLVLHLAGDFARAPIEVFVHTGVATTAVAVMSVILYSAGGLGSRPVTHLVRGRKLKAYHGAAEVHLHADHLQWINLFCDVRVRYADVTAIREIKKHTIVELGSALPIVLPHNGIIKGNRGDFVERLKAHVASVDPQREYIRLTDDWPLMRTPFISPDGKQREHLYCRKCRYDMTGVSDGQCPECGSPFNPRSVDMRQTETRKAWKQEFAELLMYAFGGAGMVCLAIFAVVELFFGGTDMILRPDSVFRGRSVPVWLVACAATCLLGGLAARRRRKGEPAELSVAVFVLMYLPLAAMLVTPPVRFINEMWLDFPRWLTAVASLYLLLPLIPLIVVVSIGIWGRPIEETDPPRVPDDTSEPPPIDEPVANPQTARAEERELATAGA